MNARGAKRKSGSGGEASAQTGGHDVKRGPREALARVEEGRTKAGRMRVGRNRVAGGRRQNSVLVPFCSKHVSSLRNVN